MTALDTAHDIRAALTPYCERIEIAGSVRRGKPDPKDIEIVCIPGDSLNAQMERWLKSGIISKAEYGETRQHRWGEKYKGFMYQGWRVELFAADADNWGYIYWLRTGPGDANQRVMQYIINCRADFRFVKGYAYCGDWQEINGSWTAENQQMLSLPEESDLFGLLGLPFIEPHERRVKHYQMHFGRGHRFGDVRRWLKTDDEPRQMSMFDAGMQQFSEDIQPLTDVVFEAQRQYRLWLDGKPSTYKPGKSFVKDES